MRQDSSFTLHPSFFRQRGFTLVEMLVVISIISLIVLIAVPSFRVMTGGRSVEAAANNLSALIGRARTEAIGLQRTSGVLFFMDQGTDRVGALVVREVTPPAVGAYPPGTVFLDMAPNGDFTLLPPGIMLNTFRDATFSASGLRDRDGYIGFNPVFVGPAFTSPMNSAITPRCGGAILFDGAGRMSVRPYRLMLNTGGGPNATTDLAKALSYDRDYRLQSTPPVVGKTCKGAAIEMYSSVGFILFDQVQFREVTSVSVPPGSGGTSNPIGTPADRREFDGDGNGDLGSMSQDEKYEEAWIDQNGTPYLVARHSGALLRTR